MDELTVPARPPALTANGEPVSPAELESAAELSRMARRLGLDKHGINGFRLYSAYVAYRELRRRSSRAIGRARSLTSQRR